MATASQTNLWIEQNRPLLEVQFDSLCIVDRNCTIVFASHLFSRWTNSAVSDFTSGEVRFCKLVDHSQCGPHCPIEQTALCGGMLPVLEVKGKVTTRPFSGLLKVMPIYMSRSEQEPSSEGSNGAPEILGSIIQIRDTTELDGLKKKYQLLLKGTFEVLKNVEQIQNFVEQVNEFEETS